MREARICNCYVRDLDAETRFYIRGGSHRASCPSYRLSGDPVDRIADEEFREAVDRPDFLGFLGNKPIYGAHRLNQQAQREPLDSQ